MRSRVVICLLVALIAALVVAMCSGALSNLLGADETPPGATPADAQPLTSEGALARPASATNGTIATRTQVARPTVADLADTPTACVQVTDHATKQPIAGAAIRRVNGGAEIAFTDERGLASVPLKDPEQLAVVVDGYLLRLVPTRLGSSEAMPQQALLVRDVWSWRRRFHLANRDGTAVSEAFVRFRPRTSTPTVSPMPQGDALLQRAWTEHTMLAGRPVCADVPVQLGSFAEDRVHRLTNDAEVRFVADGEYSFEAATTDGLVAIQEVRIEGPRGAVGQPLTIVLAEGSWVRGTVLSHRGAVPLAGAELSVQGGEPLGLLATTPSDGTFAIGPLVNGRVTLNVRHGDHEPQAFGPLASSTSNVRIFLQPLPQATLRGRVRRRPDLSPIAGATLVWTPSTGDPVRATTEADGTFLLRATGDRAARLVVQAPGHQHYAELVDPGASFADYDVWPATLAVRLEKGLSGVLQGIVVDAEGRPVTQATVRWLPAQAAAPPGMPGRRVLEGGTLQLPPVATTGDDGAFQLETNQFGGGRLALFDATSGNGVSIDVEVTAGRTKEGLRLQR